VDAAVATARKDVAPSMANQEMKQGMVVFLLMVVCED
jgi:hypothetical protein